MYPLVITEPSNLLINEIWKRFAYERNSHDAALAVGKKPLMRLAKTASDAL